MKQYIKWKKMRKWFGLLIFICFAWILGNILIHNVSVKEVPSLWNNGIQNEDFHNIPQSGDWNLILVNHWNKIPDNYNVTLIELSNGQRVDSRIYPDLQAMFDDARSEGIYPIVREGYRTEGEQQAEFEEKVQAYMNEGYSKEKAEELAQRWVALPGTSEHQLGIAVDINADKIRSSNEDVYVWLAQNAYKYGFILRYPQGKENITGTDYEPWHYRYVGKGVAEEIYRDQICLEEYLKNN